MPSTPPRAHEGREVVVQGRPLALRQRRLRQLRGGAEVGGGPAAGGLVAHGYYVIITGININIVIYMYVYVCFMTYGLLYLYSVVLICSEYLYRVSF